MKPFALQDQSKTSSPQSMAVKLSILAVLLMLCYTSFSASTRVSKVAIPKGCANACPPQHNPERFICAKSRVSKKLGMFDSECFFGRYNHCIYVREREFSQIISTSSSLDASVLSFRLRLYSIWTLPQQRLLI